MSALAEFGGKLFGKNAGDKIRWKQLRRETRWLRVPWPLKGKKATLQDSDPKSPPFGVRFDEVALFVVNANHKDYTIRPNR